ncbi:MAG: hypothetical protein V2J12_08760, partial [Gammaproteobacteria bacterium]|nr:hypothetical protein [Gammaproteobacteria bacterium]
MFGNLTLRVAAWATLALLLNACPINDNSGSSAVPLSTGLQTFESGGVEREYFLLLPGDSVQTLSTSASGDAPKPLLIALHGTGGSYLDWTEERFGYDIIGPVGDEAIMVFPNALPDANGSPQWSFASDFEFFLDLLAELDTRGLEYDPDRIFVTGHSSGAGLAHEIGCRFGDIVRAIAPSAGTLISTECVGSVAVLMAQGVNDSLVNVDIARGARRFWSLYNGYDPAVSVPGEVAPCVDHSLLGSANTPYPVYWCEHSEGSLADTSGHRWASFTGEAVWAFFSSLPNAEPTPDPPPGGGNERAAIPSDTTLTFTLRYPDDIARPLDGAISLLPPDYLENPTFTIPSVFLNTLFDVGQVGAGDTVTYTVPITFFVFSGDPVSFPSDWVLSISVYVEGGTRPTPTPGVDHQVQIPFSFVARTNPAIVDGELELLPARCFFD